MSKQLEREVQNLKKKILHTSAVVEESVHQAVRALQKRDKRAAGAVIANDVKIDQLEVEVEEDCLKVIALHQPVASDLRFIVATMRVNSDLERIGDLAVHIAQRAVFVASHDPIPTPIDLTLMMSKVQSMLNLSVGSLASMDARLAHEVEALDDEVDAMNRGNFERIQEEIPRNLPNIDLLIQFLSVSRYLERIADHASNIAEDVIYLIEGTIVRHRRGRPEPASSGPSEAL